jgi:hypothetical protein
MITRPDRPAGRKASMRIPLSTITRRAALAAAGAVAAATVVTGTAGAASAVTSAIPAITSYTATAATSVSNRPDSGDHGDWAYDTFRRTASVTLVSEVALSYCGGSTGTGHCYHWTGKITDAGTFSSIVGDVSPGNGSLNGGVAPQIGTSVTGSMAGTYHYDFYSSWKSASRALVPASENDQYNLPGGNSTTDLWPAKFFGKGAAFYVGGVPSTSLGTTGSWTYKAAAGADSACPAVSSQWTDGSPDWGSSAADGNILAPSASAC